MHSVEPHQPATLGLLWGLDVHPLQLLCAHACMLVGWLTACGWFRTQLSTTRPHAHMHTPPLCAQVRVGSMSDPQELPGLAHFCEHMLFYSSEKYPVEDEYSRWVCV